MARSVLDTFSLVPHLSYADKSLQVINREVEYNKNLNNQSVIAEKPNPPEEHDLGQRNWLIGFGILYDL